MAGSMENRMRLIIIYFIVLTFGAHSESQNALRFFLLGDWGGVPFWPYCTPVQIGVSQIMSDISKEFKMDFVLSLGDNFYLNGIKDVYDPRFRDTFEKVYSSSSLQIPWYILAGNHDHHGNMSAQLDYTLLSNRWNFPDLYYKKSFTISPSTILDVFMIDTVMLCGNTGLDSEDQKPVLRQQDIPASEEQWKWLEDGLKSSRANFLIVCGHYPVYSVGFHGNTECLVRRLIPLLQKYHVNAYISGHDHNIQHIQPRGTSWAVNYFVIGTGNFIDPEKRNIHKIPPKSLMFHWGDIFSLGASSFVEVTEQNMTIYFHQSSREQLYNFTLIPRS